MLTVRRCATAGVLAQLALLAVLGWSVGLSGAGWAVGLGSGIVVNAAMARGLAGRGAGAPGPADLVTLTRAVLAGGVAALTASPLLDHSDATPLIALAVAALLLDAVDGWVARHTGTASEFGRRFDGEVDAFLILVLSVYVARSFGLWVLAAGAARYVFAVAGWGLPWLRGQLPYRYWRKVVTATQGIVLTVAAADVLPRVLTIAALAVALGLLGESFGRDVWWLWRHRSEPAWAALPVDALALLVLWFALLAPNQPDRLAPVAFLRVPVEGLVFVGLALLLPARGRRAMAAGSGVLLGLLTVLKALDLGFFGVLDRPFSLVTDQGHLVSAVAFVAESAGLAAAAGAVVAAVLLAAAVVVLVPLSAGRLTRLAVRRRRWSVPTVTALAVVWLAGAASGLQVGSGGPVASSDVAGLAAGEVRATVAGLRDRQTFDEAVAVDELRDPAAGELAGLRGKDVLVAFVESYGRVAVEGPSSAPVQAVLDAGTRRLQASGYSAKSAFLTSPTLGGVSWLAHATLQSGMWIDNQWRYDRLLSGNRTTLSRAFGRAGWRTVAVLPSDQGVWPEGKAFYQLDKVYDQSSFGYLGPQFGFSTMPDQYALWAFQRLELEGRGRPPVMAQIDLTSSHGPWAPVPTLIDWNRLGDGSAFEPIEAQAQSAQELWSRPENVPAAYMRSIEYSLTTLISFVERYGDDNLVLILLGDHQPSPIVSGQGGGHDVPITVVARDPKVIAQISGWGWQDGMRPDARAPVWPMDAFRDRLLLGYSLTGQP